MVAAWGTDAESEYLETSSFEWRELGESEHLFGTMGLNTVSWQDFGIACPPPYAVSSRSSVLFYPLGRFFL
jgi:hypothetical protein